MEGLVFAELLYELLLLPVPLRERPTVTFAYLPSWPYSLDPHVYKTPSLLMAAECRFPHDIKCILSSRFATFIGMLCLRKSPWPNWPS